MEFPLNIFMRPCLLLGPKIFEVNLLINCHKSIALVIKIKGHNFFKEHTLYFIIIHVS